MFVFDVETLGKSTNSVVLSMAAIYFDASASPSPEDMVKNGFFVKFDVKDQMNRLHRTADKSTIDWWAKQSKNARDASFKPTPKDVTLEQGHQLMREWAESKNDPKCWVWARGTLDEMILDSIEEQFHLEPIWHFSRWRDVRTAVDFMYGTTNGYCDVDYSGFNSELDIMKHHPVDDCVLDAMMLMYGVKNEN